MVFKTKEINRKCHFFWSSNATDRQWNARKSQRPTCLVTVTITILTFINKLLYVTFAGFEVRTRIYRISAVCEIHPIYPKYDIYDIRGNCYCSVICELKILYHLTESDISGFTVFSFVFSTFVRYRHWPIDGLTYQHRRTAMSATRSKTALRCALIPISVGSDGVKMAAVSLVPGTCVQRWLLVRTTDPEQSPLPGHHPSTPSPWTGRRLLSKLAMLMFVQITTRFYYLAITTTCFLWSSLGDNYRLINERQRTKQWDVFKYYETTLY